MGVLIAVYVADFLRGSRHFSVSSQIIEEHKSRVEIHAFQYIIGNQDFKEGLRIFCDLKFVIKVKVYNSHVISTEKYFSSKMRFGDHKILL